VTINERALRNEADFLPTTLEDLVGLRRRVVAAGYPDQVASGVCAWLLTKAAGDPDRTSSDTRARYRKILAELGNGRKGPQEARRAKKAVSGAKARRVRGSATTELLTLLAWPIILDDVDQAAELELLAA
jgi:hypothetical protein